MSESSRAHEHLQRQAFRRMVHRIWNMAQAGLFEEMSEPEYRIACILMDHPEYEDMMEDTAILDGREFDIGLEGNPFLHISLHNMIEDQLGSGRPKEASSFLELMEDRGYEKHEIIHTIMKILVRLISDAAAGQKPLDVNRYRRLLTEYGDIGLEDVPEALNREFTDR